tara:strand:+ start:349 stop:672 length:324 start_codon:yes stop_codon:yes gene_type:complete
MKFLRYRDGENTLEYRPVNRLLGISDTVNDEIQLFFKATTNDPDDVDYVDLSVLNENETGVIRAIVEAINTGASHIVTVADDHTSDYIHPDLDAVVAIVAASDTNPS